MKPVSKYGATGHYRSNLYDGCKPVDMIRYQLSRSVGQLALLKRNITIKRHSSSFIGKSSISI